MLAIKYGLFAIISIFINLGCQYFSLLIYSNKGALYIAMFIGTLVGLFVKYSLDKKYIFNYFPLNKREDTKKFLLYSTIGAFMTLIFWTTEIIFDQLLHTNYAKYLGAVLGLSMGYFIKYFLDRKYVFTHKQKISL